MPHIGINKMLNTILTTVENTTIMPIILVFFAICNPYIMISFILTKKIEMDRTGMITTASQNCRDFAITLISSKENIEIPTIANIKV